MMESAQIDRLLRTFKNLEFEEQRYKCEIDRNQHLLEATVHSKVKILRN